MFSKKYKSVSQTLGFAYWRLEDHDGTRSVVGIDARVFKARLLVLAGVVMS